MKYHIIWHIRVLRMQAEICKLNEARNLNFCVIKNR